MKTIRKVFLILLVAILMVMPCQITSSAASNDSGDQDGTRVMISASAGQNGSVRYDAEKNEEIYIPPNETFESMGIEDDVFDTAPAPEPEAVDPEMSAAIEEEMWALANSTGKRSPVTTPSGFERSTCLLAARFADGSENVRIGTGWLINNNYLVTAGHNVFNWEFLENGNNGKAQHVAVYVGASNGSYLHYSMSTTYYIGGDYASCRTEQQYQDRGKFDDWAVLKLNYPVNPATTSVPKLGIRATNSVSDMLKKTYITQGYPDELNAGKGWSKWTMYKQTNCTVERDVEQPYTLDVVCTSTMEFSHGQSGSALYCGGFAEAIGVSHVTSTLGGLEGTTYFVLINDWLYNYIHSNFM